MRRGGGIGASYTDCFLPLSKQKHISGLLNQTHKSVQGSLLFHKTSIQNLDEIIYKKGQKVSDFILV